MIKDTYKTVKNISTGNFKDRGSRFIAYAYPVWNEEEIKDALTEIKKKYHDARHHCFAFRLGIDGERYRANDDGEPSGSAGLPILNQLKSFELTNVLVIVVRYFGGTLLGVPGLINAYKSATKEALTVAQIVEKTIDDIIELTFGYAVVNDVLSIVKAENLKELSHQYDLNCCLQVGVRKSKTEEMIVKFNKIAGVSAVLV